MKIEIQFLSGSRAGQRISLDPGPLIRLGRRSDNDVTFDAHKDLDVSGHHAEIRQQPDGYHLVDVGSSNGTFVGGTRVTDLLLSSGQQVTFGPGGPRIQITFQQAQGQARAPAPAAAAASPIPAAPDEAPSTDPPAGDSAHGQGVGSRTVAMMINRAVAEARQGGGGVGKSTAFVRSMVNQAVTRSTRRFKVLTVVLVLLLLGAVGGAVAFRFYEQREAEAVQVRLRQEMTALMKKQLGASESEKKQLALKLEQLNLKLARVTPAASGKEIVRRNMRAIYLMAYNDPGSGSKGYCTAFAVSKRVLASNAHCIRALESFRAKGYTSYVVMNRQPSSRYSILKVAHHPGYHKPGKSISKDVGLIKVAADLPAQVTLAGTADLQDLESGTTMYSYGFPGRLANVTSPSATLVQGVIGRITRLDGRLGTFADSFLIQHSAFTSGGTSGSPIFNTAGKVIAINAGGYVEPGSMQVMDPRTGRAERLVVSKQLAGYNFGIRIDVLQSLLADLQD
jgi:pSer/pThr/pTyr-binding forkhead associated (FHA) protein/V8-like Glu-specific endopeptidase